MSSRNNDYTKEVREFMDRVRTRHPGQEEYLQAVRRVAPNVIDLVLDNREFRRLRLFERLVEPDRIIIFRVCWEDDDGDVHINTGYRVQHSNAIGPYKGGLRFDAHVNQSILKFLAFEQSLKNSLTGLNLGAGKGGADFDPRNRSHREVMRFCQSFMTELWRHIGPMTDVPAGDIGVGEREIGFLFGQYKRLENEYSGAMTGKSIDAGGSELRSEATGYGIVHFLCHVLGDSNDDLSGKAVAVSGAGNVAVHVATKAQELGARVLTLSNRQGYLGKESGLSADDISRVREHYPVRVSLDEIAADVGAEWFPDEKPWGIPCDIAIPAATQNELDEDDAEELLENDCGIVAEGANMPLTESAMCRLDDTGAIVLPGKAANAGGVAVSGFEMYQNRLGRPWDTDRLESGLRDVMRNIHEQVVAHGDTGNGIDYCRGADRAGFHRLAHALASFGIV